MGYQMGSQIERSVSSNRARIKVAYFSQAREYAGVSEENFILKTPTSLSDLLNVVIGVHPGLGSIRDSLHFIVNGAEGNESTAAKTRLADGDEVAILVPVVGG